MRRRFKTGLCFLITVSVVLTVAATGTAAAKTQTIPSPITFYDHAPSGWRAEPVGTLLKWERVTASWPALHGLRGYRVMYVSRGALNEKVFETGMVYFPIGVPAPGSGFRLVAWDHGTSGVGDSAAPSRYPWLYPEPVSTPWDTYAQWVGKVGRMGYIVACPDYEGLGTPGLHTYLNAAAEGRATIDAVRAARHLAVRLGVRVSTRWAVTGHSQGGQAALATAELARTYGKGLKLRGTVAAAPAVEMATIIPLSASEWMGYPYSGYTAWGIRAIDPTFDFSTFCGTWILPVIDQAKDDYFDQWWDLLLSAHLDGSGNPLDPGPGEALTTTWDQSAAVQTFLTATDVESTRATGPVLILQGTDDDFYQTLDTLTDKLTALGDDLQIVTLTGQDHDGAITAGWPWAKAFLEDTLPAR